MFHVKHKWISLPAIALLATLPVACAQVTSQGKSPNTISPDNKIVTFPSSESANATVLRGFFYPPSAPAAKAKSPTIILAHGCSGMVDDNDALKPSLAAWVQHLRQAGYAVLAVDSFIPRGQREVCTQTDRPILERRERPADAHGALAYLNGRPDIDANAIYLMGFSNGATGSLYAVDASTALFKSAKHKFKAVMAFYPGCTAMSKRAMQFGAPTAIFIGRDDDWTPAAACETLVAANTKNASIYLYDNAYHGFDAPGNKVRVRMDVRNKNIPDLAKGVHVGGNDVARDKARLDVLTFLAKH